MSNENEKMNGWIDTQLGMFACDNVALVSTIEAKTSILPPPMGSNEPVQKFISGYSFYIKLKSGETLSKQVDRSRLDDLKQIRDEIKNQITENNK